MINMKVMEQINVFMIFASLIRCIVPDKDVCTVVRANLHPTLQAWFRESDIDAFVNNILFHKF